MRAKNSTRYGIGLRMFVIIAPSGQAADTSKHEKFTLRYGGTFRGVVDQIIKRTTLGNRIVEFRTAKGTTVARNPKVSMP